MIHEFSVPSADLEPKVRPQKVRTNPQGDFDVESHDQSSWPPHWPASVALTPRLRAAGDGGAWRSVAERGGAWCDWTRERPEGKETIR